MKPTLIIPCILTICLTAILLAYNNDNNSHSIKVIDSENRAAISGVEVEIKVDGQEQAHRIFTNDQGVAHFKEQDWQGKSSTLRVRIHQQTQLIYEYKRLRPTDGSLTCVVHK